MYMKRFSLLVISILVALTLLIAALIQPASASAHSADVEKAHSPSVSLPLAGLMEPARQDKLAAILISGAPIAQEAQVDNCTQWHNILAGETLYKIGLKYNVTWRKLAEINKLANPNLIYAGSKLCIKTGDGPVTTPTPTPTTTPSVKIPTFKIDAVIRDQSVTITTANFPANDTFEVLMGPFGTKGVKGTKVESVSSGQGGTFTATFNIPASMKGSARIAIRLQSPTSGYYSYNWFTNSTSN